MVKYVVIDEKDQTVAWHIDNPNTDEIYAREALEIMKLDEEYNPEIHRLYLKVGTQDDDE